MISNISQVILMPPSPSHDVPTPALTSVAVKPVVAVNTQNSVTANDAGAGQANSSGGQSAAVSDQALADAVDSLNSKVQNLNRNLEFSINDDSGTVLVKVIDANTREVLRQIPSEEALVLARNIDQYMQNHHVGLVEENV